MLTAKIREAWVVDIVLGVSMAPASVQMVLLQGENADGATVDENGFAVTGFRRLTHRQRV